MNVAEVDSAFRTVLNRFEAWVGDPKNSEVRGLYIGLLQVISRMPVYQPGEGGGVRPDTHVSDGCKTVGELVAVPVAKSCIYCLSEEHCVTVELLWRLKMEFYISSNLFSAWLIEHKSEVLEVVGDQWAETFNDPETVWQVFLAGGELEMDFSGCEKFIDEIESWSVGQLMTAQGEWPFGEDNLKYSIVY